MTRLTPKQQDSVRNLSETWQKYRTQKDYGLQRYRMETESAKIQAGYSLLRAHDAGVPISAIAEHAKVSRTTVYEFLKKNGRIGQEGK